MVAIKLSIFCFRHLSNLGFYFFVIIPDFQDVAGLVEKIEPLGRGRLNFSDFCRGMQAVMQGQFQKTKTKTKTKTKVLKRRHHFEQNQSAQLGGEHRLFFGVC